MAETRVDLLHLLEDLRDAYPGAVEETILTEVIANSLDSGADLIRITASSADASLTISDNGSGMPRRDLRRYHDLAASTKTRGQGIGFAGVEIKLALLVCKDVVTESRRGKSHVATQWHLASRHRAPWKWTPPPGMVAQQGTAVRLHLADPLSPLTDGGFIESAIRRHYQPLLDPACDSILTPLYPRGASFEVNGEPRAKQSSRAPETAPLAIHTGRKRKPSVAGYLFRETASLPEDQRGIAVSTYGKIIKRGWDWLGVSPSMPDRIGGVIEAPVLATSLTLNKGDFIRTGQRGAIYLAARKAIQEVVVRQLAQWGDAPGPSETARPRAMRTLERDLERVLLELTEGFPLLASLVEHRPGGQKRLPLAPAAGLGGEPGFSPMPLPGAAHAGAETGETTTAPESSDVPEGQESPSPPSGKDSTDGGVALPDSRRRRRPIRLGLAVQFEERPDDPEPGRLVESTVFINRAHPAYQRAAASRSEGYHVALSVALALAPLAVEPVGEHAFITTFLARWGEAVSGTPRRRKS
ncbi:MAG: ATP-binding protein [Betaproteobacteria bacterium]|nr:ATP-binding protein [Betaproteobacteria bacterium]MDH3436492.1 ATP-binding protein [Betaproteobacteria bacterium]